MSKKNNNTATESLAVLKSNLEAAELALNAVTTTITLAEKEEVQASYDEAKNIVDALTDACTDEEKETARVNFETAEAALNEIKDLPTAEDKEALQLAFDKAKTAYDKVLTPPVKSKNKTLKGVFLVSPTGRFNLGYNVGEEGEFPELQAKELADAGYLKLIE
ncbi:hypothetical protein [Flavobacterium sp. 3-210]